MSYKGKKDVSENNGNCAEEKWFFKSVRGKQRSRRLRLEWIS